MADFSDSNSKGSINGPVVVRTADEFTAMSDASAGAPKVIPLAGQLLVFSDTGVIKIGDGTHTPADLDPMPSGGSDDYESGAYSSNIIQIAKTDGFTYVPLQPYYGEELLDLTDPTQPTVLEAGTYAVSANIYGQAVDADSDFPIKLELDLDQTTVFPNAECVLPIGLHSGGAPGEGFSTTLALTYYIPAGGLVAAGGRSFDGTQLVKLAAVLYITKI